MRPFLTGHIRKLAGVFALSTLSFPVFACDTALLLAVDVSNSVDPGEYRLQIDGMADALLDRDVRDVAIQGEVMLSVMQWSGRDDQEISLPWTQIKSEADILVFAQKARDLKRAFIQSNTAPGNAIQVAMEQFSQVPQCKRHIIDISGDGPQNAGTDTAQARNQAEAQGIWINGIAIESLGQTITVFYKRSIVTQYGFVITARRHGDYPRAIREKLLRELSQVTG